MERERERDKKGKYTNTFYFNLILLSLLVV